MSPVTRHSRKPDQHLRQGRGKSGRFTTKQQTKVERRSSGGVQRNALRRRNNPASYNLRASQHHCPQCGRQYPTGDFQPEEQAQFRRSYSHCCGKDEESKDISRVTTRLAYRRKCQNRTIDPKDFYSTGNRKKCLEMIHKIKNARKECHPEEFPDLDFHHSFGSFLTCKNPVMESVDQDIGDRYREAFRRFFIAEPISLHGHVSDASSPALLTSLIAHLTSRYSKSDCNPFLTKGDKTNPCVAILEGSYGAGYGPLAHNSVLEFVRPLANGRKPFEIKTHNAAKIDDQVRNAKELGCVALIAEIVCARDGSVISEIAWKHLLRACNKFNLVLVVDEALTSIRCGAPFAYQLPLYQQHGCPDLVLFGKAVKTSGIAVDWRGINMQKLGITDTEERLFMTLEWQERLTEMAPAASLLTSWGTIVLAEKENWPQRSREIGHILRGILESEGIKPTLIGGLHSLLYLRVEDQARITSPVMGANAGKYVRWFPTLDEVMTSKEELCTKVFGPGSIDHRRDVAAYLEGEGVQLGFCSRCGQAVEAGLRPACQVCVVGICEDCEPGEHVCPMLGVSR